jgi:hypothetical protein
VDDEQPVVPRKLRVSNHCNILSVFQKLATDDSSHPLLLLANLGNTSYPDDPQWNVYNFGGSKSIRIVLHSIDPLSHSMHLHGHNFWVVAQGTGRWNGTITRPHNPQRRDTQIIDAGNPANGEPGGESYIVLDFIADNPGVWPFHCHVAWHVSDGLYINVMASYSVMFASLVYSLTVYRSVLAILLSALSHLSWRKPAVTGLNTVVTTSSTRSTPESKLFSKHRSSVRSSMFY